MSSLNALVRLPARRSPAPTRRPPVQLDRPGRPGRTVITGIRLNISAAARWAALVAALSEAARHPKGDSVAPVVGAVLLAVALVRTALPLPAGSLTPPDRSSGVRAAAAAGGVEAGLAVAAVIVTGGWHSPFLPCLLPPVLAAGLEAGGAVSGTLALAIAGALVAAAPGGGASDAVPWAIELAVVAMLAAHARGLCRSTAAETARAEASADNERRRIARDLHDRLGQRLAGLAFELDFLAQTSGAPAPAPAQAQGQAARLMAAAEDVRAVVRDLRETLGDLRAGAEPHDLAAELARFLQRVENRSGLRCHLDACALPALPGRVSSELFRVAQEAVINAERHASAQNLTLTVRTAPAGKRRRPEVTIEVKDDGRGVWAPAPDGHYGLIGMRERAAGIGARLEINAVPGQGTAVCCEVPT